MTGAALHISQAETLARFAGHLEDAPFIERRLEALVSGPVAVGVADALGGETSQEILRVDGLEIQLALTREELDSNAAADLWVSAILEALAEADAEGRVIRFKSELAYLAEYLRVRLSLSSHHQATFSDLKTLDLLTPIQALSELLRANPALWFEVTRNSPDDAAAFHNAIEACGGASMLLHLLNTHFEVHGEVPRSDIIAFSTIWNNLYSQKQSLTNIFSAEKNVKDPASRAVIAALMLAKSTDTAPLELGLLVSVLQCLAEAPKSNRAVDLKAQLGKIALRHAELKRSAQQLQTAMDDTKIAAQTLEILDILRPAASVVAKDQDAPRRERQAKAKPADHGGADNKPEDHLGPRAQDFHLRSPIAGLALVLPHLTEDNIGEVFTARQRAEALAAMATCSGSEVAANDAFIAALSGRSDVEKSPTPDRPTTRDLLFVASSLHDAVLQAEPGAPRLAAWLSARFASTLPGLYASSLTFLQRHFLHIPGELWIDEETVTVRIDPMPLLPVLQMSGRLGLSDPPRLSWLGGRNLILQVEAGGAL